MIVTNANPLRIDPSRTSLLRMQLVREFTKRYSLLASRIRNLVDVGDAFGLRQTFNTAENELLTENTRWRFATDPQKVQEFQGWLKQELEMVVPANAADGAYWKEYTQQAYDKGQGRAFSDTRKPALQSDARGVSDFYNGTREEFLRSSFGRAVAVEKVQGLAARVYSDLQGVNAAMSAKMSRTLTDGLAQGKNPRVIARDLIRDVEGIGKHRAMLLARTEIVRAHAEGQLDAFERLGVTELGVMAEWSTAGDDRVCGLCQALEGVVMTIGEARGLIPRHPQCRCVYIPANVGEPKNDTRKVLWKDPDTSAVSLKTVETQRGATKLAKARDASIRREIPKKQVGKRTLAEQKQLTPWAGADTRFAKTRPTPLLEKGLPKPPSIKPVAPVVPKPKPFAGPETIKSFATKAKAGTVPPTNLLGEKKFSRFITGVDKTTIDGVEQNVVVIFDVMAKDTGKKAFTEALTELKKLGMPIKVDNVTTKKFMDGLLRRGFKPRGTKGALWVPEKLPVKPIPKPIPKPKPTVKAVDKTEVMRKELAAQKAKTEAARIKLAETEAKVAATRKELEIAQKEKALRDAEIAAQKKEAADLKKEIKRVNAKTRAIDKQLQAQDIAHDEALRKAREEAAEKSRAVVKKKSARRATATDKGDTMAEQKLAIKETAKDYGIAEKDLKEVFDDMRQQRLQVDELLRAQKTSLHKDIGLTQGEIRDLNNAGLDFTAQEPAIIRRLGNTQRSRNMARSLRRFDEKAQQAIQHYPELLPIDAGNPSADHAQAVWEKLVDDMPPLITKTDPKVMRQAAEYVKLHKPTPDDLSDIPF